MDDVNGDWITTKQAAERLGCGQANVCALIRRGRVRGRKVVDRWLVYWPSVEHYLANPIKSGPKPKGSKPIE
jgi:excisionase family DNA binding protein